MTGPEIIDGIAAHDVPPRTVLRADNQQGFSVVAVRLDPDRASRRFRVTFGDGSGSLRDDLPSGFVGDGWTVLHRPEPDPLKVGDLVDTVDAAKQCPVGTVVVEEDPDHPFSAPAVKVDVASWMWHDGESARVNGDGLMSASTHRIVHLPEMKA